MTPLQLFQSFPCACELGKTCSDLTQDRVNSCVGQEAQLWLYRVHRPALSQQCSGQTPHEHSPNPFAHLRQERNHCEDEVLPCSVSGRRVWCWTTTISQCHHTTFLQLLLLQSSPGPRAGILPFSLTSGYHFTGIKSWSPTPARQGLGNPGKVSSTHSTQHLIRD